MSSSKRWLKEHFDDPYVKKAQREGYPSRAAYKLLEIQEKDRIIKPGMVVVDLGAAPGGWSVVARKLVGPKGEVFALDILPMDHLTGVTFFQGDFTEQETLNHLLELLADREVDLVISDMAPNMIGMKSVDQPKLVGLVELAVDCAYQILKPGGTFLTKVFQGEGVDAVIKNLRAHFKTVKIRKPSASRSRSNEVYILAQGYSR